MVTLLFAVGCSSQVREGASGTLLEEVPEGSGADTGASQPDTSNDTGQSSDDSGSSTPADSGTDSDTGSEEFPADSGDTSDSGDTAPPAPGLPECWDGTSVYSWGGNDYPLALDVGLSRTGDGSTTDGLIAYIFMDEATATGIATLPSCGVIDSIYCYGGLVTVSASPSLSELGASITYTAVQTMSVSYGDSISDTCTVNGRGLIDGTEEAAADAIFIYFN